MKVRKIIFSVLLIMFTTPTAFCQSEALKVVVNSLARFKKNKELKYIAAAKKSIDSLISINNDTANFEKNIYLAVINSTILFTDSLNSLKTSPDLTKTARLVEKLKSDPQKKEFKKDLEYAVGCLANIYIRNAFNALKRSDLLTAHQHFLNARKYAPDFKRINAYLAFVNTRLGNLPMAATFYNHLTETDESLLDNIETASAVYKAVGDTLKAIELITTAKKTSPGNNFLLLDEANIYNNKHDYASLEPLLPVLLENNGSNPDIVFIAANCYDRLGKNDKAEALYLKAIDLNSSAYEPIFNLGLLYLKKAAAEDFSNRREVLQATRWLEKANDIAPVGLGNLQALGLLYKKTENTKQLNNINSKIKQLTN